MAEVIWSRLLPVNQAFYAKQLLENPAFAGILDAMQAQATQAALISPNLVDRESGRQLYLAASHLRSKVADIAKLAR